MLELCRKLFSLLDASEQRRTGTLLVVLEEETSAPDNLTAHSVLQASRNLSGRKSIDLIAHRLSTARSCDFIAMPETGLLIGSGRDNELVGKHERYRATVGAA